MNTRGIAAEYRLTQWTRAMQERKVNGESITTFCRQRGISKNTYFYWQRKIRETTCEQLAMRGPSFAEVTVREPQTVHTGEICVTVKGIEIKLDNTYPPDKLAALVRELSKPC